MKGSSERINALLAGKTPDRIPLFDILTNDAVYAHFSGKPIKPGDDETGCRAYAAAVDGTRMGIYSPSEPSRTTLPDGRVQVVERWTTWTADKVYEKTRYYVEEKEAWMRDNPIPEKPTDVAAGEEYKWDLQLRDWLGGEDSWYLPGSNFAPLMAVYIEPGLERFSELFFECEGLILTQMDRNLEWGLKWLAGLPSDWPFPGVFLGDDFAHKTGPYFNPKWLRKHYFPKVKRYIEEAHRKNLKVMFHSDGNLMPVIDDLAECGIDLLNPVEVAAGMDIKAIHKRYPHIVFAGGIDVTNLLPHGTPLQVRDAVHRAIEDSQGKILVGSSTEVFNIVPLENFLAMRDAAINYKL